MNLWKKFRSLFENRDLTEGNPWKQILLFLIPIIMSTMMQKVYSLVDTVICGQTLSDASIAAVTNTTTIVFLILDFAIGCTMGFSVILSMKIGQKNMEDARKSICVQLILIVVISVIIALVGLLCLDFLLEWIGIYHSETDPYMEEEYQAAKAYLGVIVGLCITQLIYNQAVATLRAYGDSFTPFIFLILSTLLNIGLDLLFIMVFNWGVAGAAWATVIAQLLAGIGSWIYLFWKYKELKPKWSDFKVKWGFVWEHLKNGVPLGFSFSILYIGIVFMSAVIIKFDKLPSGEMTAAMSAQIGYGVANKVYSIALGFYDSLGLTMLSYVAANTGAGKKDRVRKGFKIAFIYGIIMVVVLSSVGCLLCINGAYQYIFLSADKVTPETIAYGNAYLYTAYIGSVILMALYIFRNSLQGMEKPLWPLLSGFAELGARIIICLYLPQLINGGPINSEASIWSFVGASLGDPGAWFFAVLVMCPPCLYYIFKKDKLEDKGKIESSIQ